MKIVLSILSLCAFLFACDMTSIDSSPEYLNSESVSAGVVVHGYMTKKGWVKNTNSFPVKIKMVCKTSMGGEAVVFDAVFQPGETRNVEYIKQGHFFYISSLNDEGIGFIKPIKNGR